MVDRTFIGGRSFIRTRSENSQAVLANYGIFNAAGTDDKYQFITNFTDSSRNNLIRIYTVGGGRSFITAVPGRFENSGTVEYETQNAQMMRYVLGATTNTGLTVTDLDGGVIAPVPTLTNKHKITESNTLDSFTMDQIHISDVADDVQVRYLGAKVNQMTVRSDTENPIHTTLDWVAQTQSLTDAPIAPPTLVSYADTPPMFYRGTIIMGGTYNDATGSVTGGTTAVQVNSVDSTVVNNLESYFSINSTSGRGLKYQIEKFREYTLRLDLNFVNTDQLRRFYDGTTTSTAPLTTSDYTPFIVVVDYKTALTDGNNFKQLRFVYQNVYFDENSIPVNPRDIVKQEITAYARNLTIWNITSEALV